MSEIVITQEMKNAILEFSKPNKKIFWIDFLTTIAIGHSFFVLAVIFSDHLYLRIIFLILCGFFYHRGILFNHEISHASKFLPGFENTYNFLFGFWVKFPTYFYETHRAHHAKNTYGTKDDPEYAPLNGQWYPIFVMPLIVGGLVPFVLFFRFGIVPLFLPFIGMSGRKFVYNYLSTFAVLPTYKRPDPTKDNFKTWYVQDLFCFIYTWIFLLLVYFETITSTAVINWSILACFIFISNHFRAMTAHVYANVDSRQSMDFSA